jgi:hypothetical protein
VLRWCEEREDEFYLEHDLHHPFGVVAVFDATNKFVDEYYEESQRLSKRMFRASSFFVLGGRSEIDKEQNGEREEDLLFFEWWEKEDGIFFRATNNSYG